MAAKIKMRVSKNRESSICNCCGEDFKHSLEMYDLMIGDTLIIVCDRCVSELLRKCCSANCRYNERLKSQEELKKAGMIHRYRLKGK